MSVINLRIDQEDILCTSALTKLSRVLDNGHTSVLIVAHAPCDNLMAN